MTYPY